MSRVLELLEELVAMPSVNPRSGVVDATDGLSGESAVARYVESWARGRGWGAHLDESSTGRYNVYVEIPGELPSEILLQTHSDTVEVEGMAAPFALHVEGDRASGRGACDAKGQLALFMAALERVNLSDRRHHSVVLAVCVDEEEAFTGVLTLCRWLVSRGDLPIGALVGEPTELRMVASHKGVVRGRIVCRGPGGHSSQAGCMINPLVTASRVVTYLEDVVGPCLKASTSPCGPATLAVTMVRGGEAINLVPREVVLSYDRRTTPDEDPQQVWRALAEDLEARYEGVEVDPPLLTDWGLPSSERSELVDALGLVLGSRGIDAHPAGVPYGSDASKIARLGIPCVVFGAGSIVRAHTVDEYVEVAQLAAGVEALADLLTADLRVRPEEEHR